MDVFQTRRAPSLSKVKTEVGSRVLRWWCWTLSTGAGAGSQPRSHALAASYSSRMVQQLKPCPADSARRLHQCLYLPATDQQFVAALAWQQMLVLDRLPEHKPNSASWQPASRHVSEYNHNSTEGPCQ